MRKHRANWIGKFILTRIIGFAIKTFIIMWLWNKLAPDVFGLHAISLIQAFGLLVLTQLLTGNIGTPHKRGRMSMRSGKLMLERWKTMKEEERKEWREGRWKE